MVLALLNYYYYAVPDVNTHASQLMSSILQEQNASSRIESQLWHSHNLVCLHFFINSITNVTCIHV